MNSLQRSQQECNPADLDIPTIVRRRMVDSGECRCFACGERMGSHAARVLGGFLYCPPCLSDLTEEGR